MLSFCRWYGDYLLPDQENVCAIWATLFRQAGIPHVGIREKSALSKENRLRSWLWRVYRNDSVAGNSVLSRLLRVDNESDICLPAMLHKKG